MTRHIVDKTNEPHNTTRLRKYLKVERAAGLNPIWSRMHKNRPGRRSPSILARFTRIERGQET